MKYIINAIVTVASAIGCGWLIRHYSIDEATLRSAGAAYASVGVTMLGFMLATLAILMSVSDRRLLRNMAKTGHLKQLIKKVYMAGSYFGFAMIVSLVALFSSNGLLVYSISLASGVLVGAILLLYALGASLWRVLTLSADSASPIE